MCVRMMLAACLLMFSSWVMGQVRETTITLGKEKIQALKMDVEAPSKDVQAALHKYIDPSKTPSKAASGSFIHRKVQLKGMNTDSVDVWSRVQKEGNNSTIYLAVKDDNGNYMSSERDSAKLDQLKTFLYNFAREQQYNSRDVQIGALMDSVRMDQSGMQERNAQRTRLQNQIRELNSQLQAIDQQEKTFRETMEQRRARLEELRGRGVDTTSKPKPRRSGQ